MTNEQEMPEPVECQGTGEINLLRLIWDDEYELTGEMAMELKYLEALRGIHAWVCVKGHCCWEGDYMLVEGDIAAECPVKMMLDSVEFHKYLMLDTMPNADGKCPYYKEGGKQ